MNRLIVIGNGFDLAHGLKTSANDFIRYYFLNAINTFLSTNQYRDELLEICFNSVFHTNSGKGYPLSIDKLGETIGELKNNSSVTFNIKSLLLEKLHKQIINELKWVDIELIYFNLLSFIKEQYPERIVIYNQEFECLKSKLITYLKEQQEQKIDNKFKIDLVKCFTEKISSREIVTFKLDTNCKPENLYFLNFNYTNTIADYLDLCNSIVPSKINYIHGSLCGEHGSPIFGFGDEKNKTYQDFENNHNNELFRHIKSFEYLKNLNFHNLTRFIEGNAYQVHIYGHSCGITDRTMLKQIFEHDNCKSIKVFYYKKSESDNDFTEKAYEISRHIEDKVMLRKKMVPFELLSNMPQPFTN